MMSFGVNEIRERNFIPTFKIESQIYYLIGNLPLSGQSPQFLQIYFISDADQLSLRSNIILLIDADTLMMADGSPPQIFVNRLLL